MGWWPLGGMLLAALAAWVFMVRSDRRARNEWHRRFGFMFVDKDN